MTTADQRVYMEATEAFLYPDVTVICGPYQLHPGDPHSVTNPVVVVEVLSPSTRANDLSAKFDHYRRLPTLQHMLYVEPDTRHVIHHCRTAEGWLRRDVEAGDVVLGALAVLSLDAIYMDLEHVGE